MQLVYLPMPGPKGDPGLLGFLDYEFARGEGTDSLIANSEHNTIDESKTATIGGGGTASFPNRIGSQLKPRGTDFTPRGWGDDTAYVPDSASVAYIAGGYDHVCNQQAGVIVGGGHNHMQSNPNGHSYIGGGSYNITSAGRSVIVGGRGNTIHGQSEVFSVIVGGDDNNIIGSSSFIGSGVGNNIGNRIEGVAEAEDVDTSVDFSAIPTGQDCSVQGSHSVASGWRATVNSQYSLAHGRDVTVDGKGSIAVGEDLNAKHAKTAMFGRDADSLAEGSLLLGGGKLAQHNDKVGGFVIDGKRTTNATLTNLQNGIRMPAGKVSAGLIRVSLMAIQEGSHEKASWTGDIGYMWDGTNGYLDDSAGASGPHGSPTRPLNVIGDNIGVASTPIVAGSGGLLRLKVAGKAATTINWVAKIDIIHTQVN